MGRCRPMTEHHRGRLPSRLFAAEGQYTTTWTTNNWVFAQGRLSPWPALSPLPGLCPTRRAFASSPIQKMLGESNCNMPTPSKSASVAQYT
ncbi:hypothetical protein K402DRAFT_77833 [Aulographum hederae CBS 113979]|uniref:Uncharacterized protein n=1 Tax=Aulographum hederae CBS 113979 TaxID=1176131 RepID=A0A6G1HG82_9PEZI|nr:hypothetical protein K402DRAFT_77833 [Aulographum hederae CBS 113979]